MAGTAVVQAGESRSSRVESLRALAALGVVFGHVFATSLGYGPATSDSFLNRAMLGGGFGVFLFFALSGFLLYRPFARMAFGGGGAVNLRRYALNRALRILPLYYSVIVILLLLQYHGGTPVQWFRYGLFLQAYYPDTVFTVDPPTWSLAVEVHFYILLPLFAALVAWLSGRRLAVATAILIVVGAASLALRFYFTYLPLNPLPAWRYATATNFIFFIPGMLLAVLQVRWQDSRPSWLAWPLSSSTAWLALGVLLWLVVTWRYSLEAVLLLAAFFTVGACVLPLRQSRVVRALDWKPLAILGVASYSLYLWHDPIVGWLPGLGLLPPGLIPLALVAFPLCCIVALISYQVLEAPWLRLRRRWAPAPLSEVSGGGHGASEEDGSLPHALPGAGTQLDGVKQE